MKKAKKGKKVRVKVTPVVRTKPVVASKPVVKAKPVVVSKPVVQVSAPKAVAPATNAVLSVAHRFDELLLEVGEREKALQLVFDEWAGSRDVDLSAEKIRDISRRVVDGLLNVLSVLADVRREEGLVYIEF